MRKTMLYRRFLLLAMIILLSVSLPSREGYRFRNLTMSDGLAANAVRNIVQDKYGYMWFGTDNGLCRYDGIRMLTFRIAELGINQYITSLMADDDGIYAGTERGVYHFSFRHQQFERLSLDIHTQVTSLAKDKDGNLWVSTIGQGLFCGEKHYDFPSSGGTVSQVFVDNNNQIWTVTNKEGPTVQKLNRLHDQFEAVDLKYSADYPSLRMLQTHDGRLWLGTWEQGLLLIHSDGRLEQVISPTLTKVGTHIHTLYERSDDCICIGCDDGVICLNPQTREWNWLAESQSDLPNASSAVLWDSNPQDLYPSMRFVYSITSDREGGLWIGTFYGGVYYLSPMGKRFDGYSVANGLTGNVISRFCEDGKGHIWVASDDGGLMCYQTKDGRFVDYPHHDQLRWRNIHALAIKGDDLWIGTYTDGVYMLNTLSGDLRKYTRTDSETSLDDYSSYAIFHDSHGQTWVATMTGVNLYDPVEDQFERIGKTGTLTIDIDEDKEGYLWLSTQGEGLFRLDTKSRKFKKYQYRQGDDTSLPDNQVNCIHVDGQGKLWIGTFSGLCKYDAKHDRFQRIPLDMPSQNVQSIVEDRGALWLATDRGIVRYVPGEGLQHFTLHDGLVSEQFQTNSGMKASDGRIYFGTTNGFNAFYPFKIKANTVMPPVYIVSLRIMNRDDSMTEGIPQDLTLAKELTLDYSDARMISLYFASLSYCSPEKNQYAYMLDGFDHEWNYVGNQHVATYTNIPAGTYTFRVKATNNDGIWSTSEATLRIVVHPPFWWSWWAQLCYLLLAGAAIWYYVHLRLKREKNLHQQEMEQLNLEKEREVRDARLQFFTMIAHEIRTPVTLIIGPLEKLMKHGNASNDLKVINRNAHRLLELVNQLLDFRKVEQHSLVMHFAAENIHDLIENVSERFAPTFAQNDKHFTVEYPDKHFTATIDKEAVTKVVSNLLTNANKYTKDEVRLTCSKESNGQHFRISVSDNGIGIGKEDIQHIFDPFFQAEGNKPGTGIGLSIVKKIVDLHFGTITVESEKGKGSTFTVTLPVTQEVTDSPTAQAASSVPIPQQVRHDDAVAEEEKDERGVAVMLIVDDSEDMVEFLAANFRGQYNVLTACDGMEALEILARKEVGIIISDWMMPRMDGTAFCRRVRMNPLTSHIPFVMLTAKTDDASKVRSMDVGADIYIEKPFSMQYLQACIRNMLQIRRQLMEKFSTQPLEPVTEIAQSPTDNDFLIKMKNIIEENFSNSDLNVNFLADKLNISRSGLFAKIKSLADITPNEMIMIVRLKRAAQLLQKSDHTVSEVSYMVGFSNPSYFSKCFHKQFGIRPTEYMNAR